MQPRLSRRALLRSAAIGASTMALARTAPGATREAGSAGCVIGEPTAEKTGAQILADGGNVADAIVGAALTAAVAAPNQTGIGGYAGTAIFAFDGGRRIAALDFNSTAPAAARADMFQPDADGKVPGRHNEFGWLAAGVPGILAGLQLALERFGTLSFGDVVQPAIQIARKGFPWPASLATVIRNNADRFGKDPGSRHLFFADDKPLAARTIFRNQELAEMLAALARANSVEAFYRGDIAQRIADAFQRNGGLVTARDLAAYQARLVEPIAMDWGEARIHTVPLTAGGLSVLQALKSVQQVPWNKLPAGTPQTHARVEALRKAWHDRLLLLGDPGFGQIPTARLLSRDYARQSADEILAAVTAKKLIPYPVKPNAQRGTINLSAADRHGNLAALTLTHGGAFGARVTIDGLGLTLGHGMSRFDPRPGHPNAPGPGKRPLHNMVPTIVTRSGKPVLAVGGRGGRKIPNALFEMLFQFVSRGLPLADAIAAPRMHTEGDAAIEHEKHWPVGETGALGRIGYQMKAAASATLSAVVIEDGVTRAAMR